jgi:RimJ/RimL family protein N-acetyltransferase
MMTERSVVHPGSVALRSPALMRLFRMSEEERSVPAMSDRSEHVHPDDQSMPGPQDAGASTGAARPDVQVSLERWGPADQIVIERSNTPEMTVYLGGPESPEQVMARHAKFLRFWETGEASMFRIVVAGEREAVGSIGYWRTEWEGRPVYETGWSIHSAHQGRGIASRALAACLRHAAEHGEPERSDIVAFPRIDNTASNALCRRAGFVFRGEQDFEYPKGRPIRVNAWVFDLRALRSS